MRCCGWPTRMARRTCEIADVLGAQDRQREAAVVQGAPADGRAASRATPTHQGTTVKPTDCEYETDVWEAVATGRWPERSSRALSRHVTANAHRARTSSTSRPTLLADAAPRVHESAPPSSAIVWWRAQMRARQEAARVAEQPLTFVHALAIACAAGLLVGLIGLAGAWIRGGSVGGHPPPPPTAGRAEIRAPAR